MTLFLTGLFILEPDCLIESLVMFILEPDCYVPNAYFLKPNFKVHWVILVTLQTENDHNNN